MDSAGNYLPDDVTRRIGALGSSLHIPVGFHGHNNISHAVANTIAAMNAGATILDGTAKGFGAGAGNTQLEVLLAVLERMEVPTGIDLKKYLLAAEYIELEVMPEAPRISSVSIASGLAGVFSGFAKPVIRVSKQFNVDPSDVFAELGRRRAVAGQEDLIVEVASRLAERKG